MATVIEVVFNDLGKSAGLVRRAGRELVTKAVTDLEARLVANLSGQRSGRMYGAHQASAPGEAPAWDTGNLASSVTTAVLSDESAEVRIGAEYAPALEYGSAKIAPRPWVTPTADAFARDLESLGAEIIQRVVK